ncbi:hypothetical protein FOZ63_031529, partial [Perkinsus olseni]
VGGSFQTLQYEPGPLSLIHIEEQSSRTVASPPKGYLAGNPREIHTADCRTGRQETATNPCRRMDVGVLDADERVVEVEGVDGVTVVVEGDAVAVVEELVEAQAAQKLPRRVVERQKLEGPFRLLQKSSHALGGRVVTVIVVVVEAAGVVVYGGMVPMPHPSLPKAQKSPSNWVLIQKLVAPLRARQ